MNQQSSLKKAHAMAERIFRDLLPENGLVIREAQITLCHEMLDALFESKIALCDAGVGIGKTHAYLVACILWQVYRPQSLPRPVVISTSSVALQDAILKEYIPFLSRVLLKEGILDKPIQAVVRKGKERFVCDLRLAERLAQIINRARKGGRQQAALHTLEKTYDLDEVLGLSGFDRRLICVPEFCPKDCSGRSFCRYQQYLRDAQSADIAIQICNHNYLLADAGHRMQEMRPLLRDYHALVVDEAHKLPDAARQMFSLAISPEEIRGLSRLLEKEHFTHTAQRLREALEGLQTSLSLQDPVEDQKEAFRLTPARRAALKATITSLRQVVKNLASCLPRWEVYQLEKAADILSVFYEEDKRRVLYIQYDRTGAPTLCAASRDVPEQMARALWTLGKPVILTSGTLAAGHSFERTREMMGLEKRDHMREFFAQSPFDYRHNCLLYIPTSVPQPRGGQAEATYLSRQIETLITATYGHALVLFTSYRLMGEVHTQLQGRVEVPLLESWRHGQQVVQLFKQLPNAVLLAAGSCWEGVDFPGDMVSLLVITRLPFPVPDPLSEAEQELFPSLQAYIQAVVVPDMQRKLRQGFGRAIRTETDTCVVAVLDNRAAAGQRYREAVLEALPECRLSDSIAEVEQFIRERKPPQYFESR